MKKPNPYLHPDQTPEEMLANARAMGKMRWRGTTAAERTEAMRALAIHPGEERCPCGKMTLKRAQARADKAGTGLGHRPGCSFYRRQRRPGKRKAVRLTLKPI